MPLRNFIFDGNNVCFSAKLKLLTWNSSFIQDERNGNLNVTVYAYTKVWYTTFMR